MEEHTFENRGKFDKKVFFWHMECYLAPIVLFGPMAFFSGAMDKGDFLTLAADPVLAVFSILAFIVLPVFMYSSLRKKFEAYDGSKESIRSTNLYFKNWYNANIAFVVGFAAVYAILIIVRAKQTGLSFSQFESNTDAFVSWITLLSPRELLPCFLFDDWLRAAPPARGQVALLASPLQGSPAHVRKAEDGRGDSPRDDFHSVER